MTSVVSSRSDQEESLRLNSSAVRRIDRDFLRLRGVASQAAIYAFNVNTGAWDKTDAVGCLFLYERSTDPQFGFVIMNRKAANNFVLTFGEDAEIHLESPYLLLRCTAADGSPVIHCLWFYDENDCHQFAETLQKLFSCRQKHNNLKILTVAELEAQLICEEDNSQSYNQGETRG